MPASFDDELQIDGGRIVPAGPYELEDDEEVTRLYAWVVQANQDGTAAICSGFQDDFPDRVRWGTRADAYHAGQFRTGQALAMAVMISRSPSHFGLGGAAEDPRVYWWSETVRLREAE